ncbi:acyltransferase family protein [Sphaerotilus microaerophilus]|uniref:acyltransferase family protein n=1 Tax=Sphaerotilus microaerophilus TaxID=2914710 RepID=UPI002073B555|nr:acyltransferase [Sphaerotilus sp. FB-5]
MGSDSGKFAYIDQLRGGAVLMVMLVHTSQKIPGLSVFFEAIAKYGQMGVQLFFVASAYTLCLSASRRADEVAGIRSFYVRRYFRIAPLYYLGIFVYAGIHWMQSWSGHGWPGPYTISNIAANALFVHGIVPSANNSVVPGGWSIGAEMLFYLIFPALHRVCGYLFDFCGNLAILALAGIFLLANIIFQWSLLGTEFQIKNSNFMYFFLVNQMPVFIFGILTYFILERTATVVSARWCVLAFVILTLLVLYVWRFKAPVSFMVMPTLAGLSFCFLLAAMKTGLAHSKWLQRLGRVSYSVYVFHFIFAWHVAPFIVEPLVSVLNADVVLLFSVAVVVLATFYLASWTERAIEARWISFGNRVVRSLQARVSGRPQI